MIQALEKFKKLTGYDIKKFFEDFILFCNSNYPLIVAYYTGQEGVDVGDSFDKLDKLISSSEEIEPLFYLKSNGLSGINFWELLDYFSDCQTKLWTINNSSKWLRSSRIGRYSSGSAVDRVLKTNESFENVANDLGSSNPDNDWVDISKNNFVEEEDYTPNNSDKMFKIYSNSQGVHDITNIVDNLDSEKILGKDIDVYFRFVDGDIATVIYEDAVKQAFNTILSSLKGSIPEFPEYGIPNESIGSSVNAVQYPMLFKHLINMFQRDARWVEVNLLDIYKEEDNLYMQISAKTVTNNYLKTNIRI